MIKIIKLISGEELIADITEVEGKLNVKQPAVIHLVPSRTEQNQIMVGLLPYAQYTKSHSLEVAKTAVLWTEEPADELYNQYNSIFGSGIQLL